TSVLISDWVGVEAPADGRISVEAFAERAREVDREAREAAAAAFATDPRDTSTPAAMIDLLEQVWRGEALTAESTELLKDVLLRVETGAGRIKGILPPGTRVGHKTGTIGGTTNDVGYIYLPDDAGHIAIAVFVKDSDEPVSTREAAIAQISRAVYDYFLFTPR
ncbi:MAG: serine hydrolase, partial [Gemmatimonadota bacterium]|nr:serine hydrolase [Gemmatimonadota bacterium]